MTANEASAHIVDAAMKVHSVLGPGLLESAYQACLAHELRRRNLRVTTQVPLPVRYDGVTIDLGYRLDMLVEDSVVVELKAINRVRPIDEAQLLSYLKLGDHRLGLLINFHELHLRNAITRMANRL